MLWRVPCAVTWMRTSFRFWKNSVRLYAGTPFCASCRLLMDTQLSPLFASAVKTLPWTLVCKRLLQSVFSSLEYVPGSETARSHGNFMFSCLKQHRTFSQWLCHLPPGEQCTRTPFLTASPTLASFHFKKYCYYSSHPKRSEMLSYCGFDLHFPTDEGC